jgi:tetratricopeptide (TPR) repeat protein
MKKLLTLTLASLFASSTFAEAPATFKMTVVQGTNGASDIRKGNYEKGIESIVTDTKSMEANEQLAMQMNLCVAYANSSQFALANKACDQAITLSKTFVELDNTATKFVAFALNNRAIYKTKIQDFDGALQDLMEAAQVNNTSIVEDNLLKLIHQQADNIQFKAVQVTQA